jgi:hypothetical protein
MTQMNRIKSSSINTYSGQISLGLGEVLNIEKLTSQTNVKTPKKSGEAGSSRVTSLARVIMVGILLLTGQ